MDEQEEYFVNLLNSCMPLRAQSILAYTVFPEMGRVAKELTRAQNLVGFSPLHWTDTREYTEVYTPGVYKEFTEWVPTRNRYEVVVAHFEQANGLCSPQVIEAVMRKMFELLAPQVGRLVVLGPTWLQASEDLYPMWMELFPHFVFNLIGNGIQHPVRSAGQSNSLYIFDKDRYGNPTGEPGTWKTFLYRDMLWKRV